MDNNLLVKLRILKKELMPSRMILFGSMARGDMHEGSDVDVLIILDTNSRFTDRIEEVLKLWDYSVAIEPVVYTPDEFEKKLKSSDFLRTVIEEGVEI